MSNFTDILNKPASEIERPKPIPVGSYIFFIPELPKFDKVGEKETPVVDFTCRYLRAQDDVDAEQLAEAGGLTNKDGQPKQTRLRFFLTEDALFRLKEFLLNTLQIEDSGQTIGQMLNDTMGKQFVGAIRHRPSQDKQSVYAEIASTAAL